MPDQTPLDVEAIQARLDAATPGPWKFEGRTLWGRDNLGRVKAETPADRDLIESAPTDLRRLLDENARLNAENARYLRIINEITRDNAGLTSCLDAVQAEAHKMLAEHGQSWNSISGRRILNVFDAAPEMPRPPAEEGAMAPDEETEDAIRGQHQTTVRGGNWVSLRCDCREWELEVPAGLDAMPRLKAAHAEHVAEMVAEGARLAAQKPVSGPETAGTGSGRGTGVAEAQNSRQACGEEA